MEATGRRMLRLFSRRAGEEKSEVFKNINCLILSEYSQHRLSFHFILKRGQEVVCVCPLTSSSSCVYAFNRIIFPSFRPPLSILHHPSALL